MRRFVTVSGPVRRYVVPPFAAWVLIIALAASGLVWINGKGLAELRHRFNLRIAIASDFVSTYVDDLIARERVQALRFLSAPVVDARTFEMSVASFGYPAAALLDGEGRALHVAPMNVNLIGSDIAGRYPHLQKALRDNVPTVSPVVASAAAGLPVVSFAVPYESGSGRRVFAGAMDIRSSPLGAYLVHAIALTGSEVFLIDTDGTVVGSNQAVNGVGTLTERAPELAAALRKHSRGSFEDEETWRYDSTAVEGTTWRLVAAVRQDVLYQPLADTTAAGWVALAALALLGLFGVRLWARGSRNRTELRESEERFRGLFDSSLVGMLLSSSGEGRLMRVNPALCEMLGYRADQLVERRVRDIVHPDDLAGYHTLLAEAVSGGRHGFTTDLRFVDAMSRPRQVSLTASLVRDSDGAPLYFATQAVDVSERHRLAAEQRRIRVELTSRAAELERANNTITAAQQRTADLVAMLSHDVRSPLGVITGYCELLLDGWNQLADDKKRREIGRISRAGTQMMQLVEEVLTLTEVDQSGLRPRRTAIPMDDAVAQAVAGLGIDQRADLRVDVEAGLAVLADPGHLQQILINLLSNARKYGGEGPVWVQVGRLDNAQVEICVVDTGEGVPADFVPHLFERYSRAQSGIAPTRRGTGLGLYITRELVEANGGTIRYEANRPTGSRFVLELPADPARMRELNATAR